MNATALPAMPGRKPFDPEDTDWGREIERRHQENLARLDRGDKRFDALESKLDKNTRKLDENTALTGALKKSLDALVDETSPYVKLSRAVRTGAVGASHLGHLGQKIADFMFSLGKGGAALLAIYLVFSAVLHGVSPIEALKLLWQIVFHSP